MDFKYCCTGYEPGESSLVSDHNQVYEEGKEEALQPIVGEPSGQGGLRHDMKKEISEKIEEIICRMKCPKDFICYRSGFSGLCTAEDIGLESFVACMSVESQQCEFSINFGGRFFCKCPLRICISKNLENKN